MKNIDTHSLRLAVYNTSENKFDLNHDFDGRVSFFEEKIVNISLLQAAQKKLSHEDRFIVFVDAQVICPDYWLTRLLTTLNAAETAVICSALNTHNYQLSPLAQAGGLQFEGALQELDKLIYYFQPNASWFETDTINFSCFIIDLELLEFQLDSLLLVQYDLSRIACDHLLIQPESEDKHLEIACIPKVGNQHRLALHPLAQLQYQIAQYKGVMNQLPLAWLGLDDKPVILHICNDWGYGIEKWVNDFCEADQQCHHLVLRSQGEFFRRRHGEQLVLFYGGTVGLEIMRFNLTLPISSIVVEHAEYQRMLDGILQTYHVKGIMASTLIGHSMDCLRTALPTMRIFHDFFPDWPALDARLEEHSPDLELALRQSEAEPFGAISKVEFEKWRDALVACYKQDNVMLVAPNQSVLDNLKKISSEVDVKKVTIIPHGIYPFSPVVRAVENSVFTILLPGKLSVAKGKQLLEDCLPQLADYRLILLGSGGGHGDYTQYENVEIVENYQAIELPDLLQYYQPDVAILLSSVSETFSYTLSEMIQAEIPVIATPSGAFKYRIQHGETGFIVQANKESLLNTLQDLEQHPNKLAEIRANLAALVKPNMQDMIEQYLTLWEGVLVSAKTYCVAAPQQGKYIALAQPALELKQVLAKQVQDTQEQVEEWRLLLEERTDWALELQKQIDELSSAVIFYKDEAEKTAEKLKVIQASFLWKIFQQVQDGRLRWLGSMGRKMRFKYVQLGTYLRRLKQGVRTHGIKGTINIIYKRLTRHQPQLIREQSFDITLQHDFTPFTVKMSDQPHVSIIIPVYNQFLHTYNCLQSLAEHESQYDFEIIVIDDCSSDETAERIQEITGIHYHRQIVNGGFIASCNQGAKLAKGEYVLFLNNDTLVQTGWLDSLMAIFEAFPDAGLVGSKLVYPNGVLQEAGGIIFSDASGWNYGRGNVPLSSEYEFVREVDYCSGASVIIRQDLFEQLGAFDTRYKPAYYEDVDLAFAVRAVGKKVYYQPASVVIHFEGVTSGTDTASGAKRYQIVNQEKFLEKWGKVLKSQLDSGGDIELSRLYGQPKRVLIYDACVPMPDQDAGSLRMVNMIKTLQDLGYHVIFMAENMPFMEVYTDALQQMGVECLYRPYVKSPIDYFEGKGKYIDVVIVSRYYIAEPVMKMIRQYCTRAAVIFDTVDLHYLREQRLAEFEKNSRLSGAAQKTRSRELAVIEQADITLVVSSYEKEFLATEAPNALVEVVSTIHDIHGRRREYAERKDIMFVGGYQHTPNVDAIMWFAKHIFPLVRQQLDIHLHIIGSKATKEIEALQGNGVVFHGYVDDIEPFMDNCRIAIAPLRYGAGVKGKVSMSMSYGQPVVATSIAAEGMHLEEGHNILMADSEVDFAQAVIRLYNDEQLWLKISENGLENVAQWFSFEAAKKAVGKAVGKANIL